MKQRKIIVVMLILLCALPGCIQQSVGEAQVDFCQALSQSHCWIQLLKRTDFP